MLEFISVLFFFFFNSRVELFFFIFKSVYSLFSPSSHTIDMVFYTIFLHLQSITSLFSLFLTVSVTRTPSKTQTHTRTHRTKNNDLPSFFCTKNSDNENINKMNWRWWLWRLCNKLSLIKLMSLILPTSLPNTNIN